MFAGLISDTGTFLDCKMQFLLWILWYKWELSPNITTPSIFLGEIYHYGITNMQSVFLFSKRASLSGVNFVSPT